MRLRYLLPALATGTILAACGSASVPAASGPSKRASSAPKLVQVNLRLPYLALGYDAPFSLANEKGFYTAAGFKVDILEGKGSATTVETVGTGSDAFGVTDAGTAAELISKGAPVKVVADYVQQSPLGLYYDPSYTHFKGLRSLVGKTIITFGGDADYQMWPAVLSHDGLKPSQFKYVMAEPSNENALFASHRGDIFFAPYTSLPLVRHFVPTAKFVSFTRYGVNLYSFGLVTNLKRIKQHPGQVRRFVAATTKGWAFAIKHPAQAVAATLKEFPKANKAIIAGGFGVTRSLVHTAQTQGHPLGWMAQSDWRATLSLLHRYAGMKAVKAVGDYYTNEFVPAS